MCNTCMFVQMEAMEKKSLHLCVTFLEQIAKTTSTVVLELCAEQCNLNDKVRKHWVPVVKIKLRSSRVEISPLFSVSCSCLLDLLWSCSPNTVLTPSAQLDAGNKRSRRQRKEKSRKRSQVLKAWERTGLLPLRQFLFLSHWLVPSVSLLISLILFSTHSKKCLKNGGNQCGARHGGVKIRLSQYHAVPTPLLTLCLCLSLPSLDKMHLTLTELCCCYSLCSDLIVFNHAITPTEFLLSHLEIRLSEYAAMGEEGMIRFALIM